MPEEDEGFTFVDRRRAAVGEPPAPAPDTPQPAPDDAAGDESIDIYGVLGYCLSLIAQEAWKHLGLIADPQTGEAREDLAQAKTAIDAVGDLAARLEAAPAAAVPDTLRRDLRALLNDLRLNYVARQDRPA